MLDFGKLKALQPKLEKNTEDYLQKFFQAVLDAFSKHMESSEERLFFCHCTNYGILKRDYSDILRDADSQKMLEDLSFYLTIDSSRKLTLNGFSTKFEDEDPIVFEAVSSYLCKNGFSYVRDENGTTFIKTL